ncbi:hypothetical protein BDW69DRAFT_69505 [Aspergillus filifer]
MTKLFLASTMLRFCSLKIAHAKFRQATIHRCSTNQSTISLSGQFRLTKRMYQTSDGLDISERRVPRTIGQAGSQAGKIILFL